MVKNPAASAGDTGDVGLIPGQGDPLDHCSIFAWKILWTEEPGRIHGIQRSWTQLSSTYTQYHVSFLHRIMGITF